jgi:hypothetical protein
MCKAIDSFPEGTDILTRISAAANFNYNYDLEVTSTTNNTCLYLQQYSNDGWKWQVKYLFFQIKTNLFQAS